MLDAIKSASPNFFQNAPDFISLGAGNGEKDRIILRKILKQLPIPYIGTSPFYYPYDISRHMLAAAVNKVRTDSVLRKRVYIKAVYADFAHLKTFIPVYDHRPEPNLFALLGNTLGNYRNELELFSMVRSAMSMEDFLIVEVRLSDNNLILRPGGSDENRKRFNFSPLEFLGIPFEEDRVFYTKQEPSYSQINDTVSDVGIYRGRINIGHESFEDVILCSINYYSMNCLIIALNGSGFDVIYVSPLDGRGRSRGGDKMVGIVVVRKQRQSI